MDYGMWASEGVGRGKVVFLYNLLDLKRTTWEGRELGAEQAHHRPRLQIRRTRLREGQGDRCDVMKSWHGISTRALKEGN